MIMKSRGKVTDLGSEDWVSAFSLGSVYKLQNWTYAYRACSDINFIAWSFLPTDL